MSGSVRSLAHPIRTFRSSGVSKSRYIHASCAAAILITKVSRSMVPSLTSAVVLASSSPSSRSIGLTASATALLPTYSVAQDASGCPRARRQIMSITELVASFISMAAPIISGQLISNARFGTAKRMVPQGSLVPAYLHCSMPRRAQKTGGGVTALAAFFHSNRRKQATGEIRRKADACGSAGAAGVSLQSRPILSGGAA